MATRSGRLTIGLVGALVAVLVLGSVGAVAIARHERVTGGVAAPEDPVTRRSVTNPTGTLRSPTDAASSSRRTAATSSGATTPASASSDPSVSDPAASSAESPAATGSPAESDPSNAPAGPSNNLTVQMSPAARTHARAQDVQQALQSYFDAINQHDYPSWTQSVTRSLASHQTSEQWLQAYATTMDSSIWMQSMRDDPLQVQVRFTSQQDPDLAPPDMKVACIHWALTFQMAEQDGQPAVDSTVDGSVSYAKC